MKRTDFGVYLLIVVLSLPSAASGAEGPNRDTAPAPLSGAMSDAIRAYDAGDYAAARANWSRAAEAGDRDAMTALANLYLSGEGGKADPVRGLMWYHRAARAGDVVAQLNLGEILAEGRVTARDDLGAYFWLSLAGQAGNGWAARFARKVGLRLSVEQRRRVESRIAGWHAR